jgi:hypothetical protein
VEEEADIMLDHTRKGLRALLDSGRVQLVDWYRTVAPGVSTLLAPGIHPAISPAHLAVVVADGTERAVLMGDAISCRLARADRQRG